MFSADKQPHCTSLRLTRCARLTLAVLTVTLGVATATADTVHVPSEQPTIQAGIDAAGHGGTVVVASGTYTGTGNTGINMGGLSVELTAPDGPSSTIIDCESGGQAFIFMSPDDTTAVIDGFTVRNGVGSLGGAIYISAASPTIGICNCEMCTADNGGAICAASSASPQISGCVFTGNTAEDGGALYVSSYEGNIAECTFEDCVASNGGALYLDRTADLTLVQNCVFRHNTADIGGGVYYGQAETSINGCTFFDNTATLGGGIYLSGNYNYPEITRCSFVANDGGGAVSAMAELSFSQCLFAFDKSGPGFSCLLPGWDPDITHCVVFGNAGGDSLCGIHADNLFVDPRLCGLATGDLTLCKNSECLQAHNPWNLDVGANGSGCGDCDSPVRRMSWGALKGIYRER